MLAHIAAGSLVEVIDALIHLLMLVGVGVRAMRPAALYTLWQHIRRKRK